MNNFNIQPTKLGGLASLAAVASVSAVGIGALSLAGVRFPSRDLISERALSSTSGNASQSRLAQESVLADAMKFLGKNPSHALANSIEQLPSLVYDLGGSLEGIDRLRTSLNENLNKSPEQNSKLGLSKYIISGQPISKQLAAQVHQAEEIIALISREPAKPLQPVAATLTEFVQQARTFEAEFSAFQALYKATQRVTATSSKIDPSFAVNRIQSQITKVSTPDKNASAQTLTRQDLLNAFSEVTNELNAKNTELAEMRDYVNQAANLAKQFSKEFASVKGDIEEYEHRVTILERSLNELEKQISKQAEQLAANQLTVNTLINTARPFLQSYQVTIIPYRLDVYHDGELASGTWDFNIAIGGETYNLCSKMKVSDNCTKEYGIGPGGDKDCSTYTSFTYPSLPAAVVVGTDNLSVSTFGKAKANSEDSKDLAIVSIDLNLSNDWLRTGNSVQRSNIDKTWVVWIGGHSNRTEYYFGFTVSVTPLPWSWPQ